MPAQSQCKVLLRALMLETKRADADEVAVEAVLARHASICRAKGFRRVPDAATLRSVCTGLAQSCFVRLERARDRGRGLRIQFEMHPEDIHYALKDDDEWARLMR